MVASPSLLTTSHPWKWRSGSRDPFIHFGAQTIFGADEVRHFKFGFIKRSLKNILPTRLLHVKVLQYGGAFRVTWPLKILEIRGICQKQYTIEIYGRLTGNHVSYRMAPISLTLSDLECHSNLSNSYLSMNITRINIRLGHTTSSHVHRQKVAVSKKWCKDRHVVTTHH